MGFKRSVTDVNVLFGVLYTIKTQRAQSAVVIFLLLQFMEVMRLSVALSLALTCGPSMCSLFSHPVKSSL